MDTVVRPLNDGGMIFQAIRDDSAPEEYSYQINLGEEQELRQIDPQHVGVYAAGNLAMTISATPASDAIGTEVPTTLRISREEVLTLTVHYKAGDNGVPFVYPVMAGTGWEGGYRTILDEMRNPLGESGPLEEPISISEEEEPIEYHWFPTLHKWGAAMADALEVGAPEPAAREAGSATLSRPFKGPACYVFPVEELPTPLKPNTSGECNLTGDTMLRGWVHGHFHTDAPGFPPRVWWDNGREAEVGCGVDYEINAEWHYHPYVCRFAGENQQEGSDSYIYVTNEWLMESPLWDECQEWRLVLHASGSVSRKKFRNNEITEPACPEE